jgi:WD40 repeat protein
MAYRCNNFTVTTVTKELVSWMRGHESSVCSISVHASGRYAITTSSDTAQLWDLDTFQRKRKLNIRQSVGIQKVGVSAWPSPALPGHRSQGAVARSHCVFSSRVLSTAQAVRLNCRLQLCSEHSSVWYVQNMEVFLLNYYSCEMSTAVSNRSKMS